jgi:hypothetical protein
LVASFHAESVRLPKIDLKARRVHFMIQTNVSRSFGFNPILRPFLPPLRGMFILYLIPALGFIKISAKKDQNDERKIKSSILLEISTKHNFPHKNSSLSNINLVQASFH